MVNNIFSGFTAKSAYSNNNSKIPDIPDLPTSGQYKTSDSVFKDKIMEMARRDVAAGKNSRGSKEWIRLMDYYSSAVSPDRKGIVNSTVSSLGSKMNLAHIKFNGHNFFQVLFANSGMFGSRDIGANFINFRDSNGNVIATFGEKGWGYVPTKAEISRGHEFIEMWDDAVSAAEQEVLNTNTIIECVRGGVDIDLAKLQTAGSHMDMGKLAKYGITLDDKTGQTNVNKDILDMRI